MFPCSWPGSPLSCHLVALPLFIHVPAAGIGGETCLVQQGREQQTAIPLGLAASWGLLLQRASASRLGELLLQPAAPEQQDVGNRESPGSRVMVGGGFERNGWALCWHLALLTSGAVFSPHIHCKGCYKRMFPRPNRQMWSCKAVDTAPVREGIQVRVSCSPPLPRTK